MFDFNLMKIAAEQIKSGSTLSKALDVAEAQRICLSVEWIRNFLKSKYKAATAKANLQQRVFAIPIAFNPLRAYHLHKVTSHTVEGDGETTVVGKTLSHYKTLEKLARLYRSFHTFYTIEEVNDHE